MKDCKHKDAFKQTGNDDTFYYCPDCKKDIGYEAYKKLK